MSLVTCCPACTTMFKVVPDQLRISEGWVRCGHCAEVFDARAHLAPVGAADAPSPGPMAARPAAAPLQVAPAPAKDPVKAPASAPASVSPAAPAAAAAATPPYPPFVLVRQDSSDPEPPTASPALPARPRVPAPASAGKKPEVESGWHESWRSSELPPAGTQWPSQIEPDDGAAASEPASLPADDVSFLRQGSGRSFWRRGGVRAALAVVALVLLASLAAQFAVQQRDLLAAARPALRPWLEALCRPLQCRIGPPRQIEAVVIDSSAFNRLRPDAYRLNVTLKNQAPIEVAMPALELTLTDTQDQPVVRRVLPPAELGPGVPATLSAGADWSTSLGVTVVAEDGASRIAGYRLLAFYP